NILITHNSVDVNSIISAIHFVDSIAYDFVTFEDVEISCNYIVNHNTAGCGISCGAHQDAFKFDRPVISSNYIHLCDAGINSGNLYDADVSNNLFENNLNCGAQIGVLGGSVTDNKFEGIYQDGGDALQLWGGEWETAASTDVLIEGNTITYNDISPEYPTHGIRLRPPVGTDPGIDGSTIHIHNNNFIDGGLKPRRICH
ncbi:unnamed protein product, partial [marine sediment metagenome]